MKPKKMATKKDLSKMEKKIKREDRREDMKIYEKRSKTRNKK